MNFTCSVSGLTGVFVAIIAGALGF
jgi:hypothetical protein